MSVQAVCSQCRLCAVYCSLCILHSLKMNTMWSVKYRIKEHSKFEVLRELRGDGRKRRGRRRGRGVRRENVKGRRPKRRGRDRGEEEGRRGGKSGERKKMEEG
uniref:Uncharacterized protein n=1 Tax=Cacopsylla melanoneura TaxID=428564 RepID=A0A8D8TX82_9HEMI